MTNPAHTLVINWDADGNMEFKDLQTGVEGEVAAGDLIEFVGAGGRIISIDNKPSHEDHNEEQHP